MMPGRRTALSDAQLGKMAELREAGTTIPAIQRHFAREGLKLSRGALDWQCLKLGADLPPALRRHASPAALRGPDARSRPFLPEDDKRLLALEGTGEKVAAIAIALGRSRSSIRGRLMTLARLDARAEEQA